MAVVESLSVIKDFGRFQKSQFFLFCLGIFPHAWFSIGNTFYSASVDHYCRVADNQTYSENSQLKKCFIPSYYVKGRLEWDSCIMYDPGTNLTNTNISAHDGFSRTCQSSNITRKCDQGWIYDKRYLASTVVTEFDLVCKKDFMKQISKSVSAFGELIGCLIFGQFADVYGRKPTVLIAGTLSFIFGISTAFVPSFILFITGTFLSAMSISAIFMIMYVLAMEATPSIRRPLVSSGCTLSYSTGYVFLGITAYIVHGNWRVLQFISGVVCLLYIPYIWVMEESVRWLLQAGEITKARNIIKRATNINGEPMNEEMMDTVFLCSMVKQPERKSLLSLLKTPVIRKRILNISLCWFATGMMYFGISMNANFFAKKNPYAIFIFTAAVEIPAVFLNLWLLQRYQRRLVQCISLILTGAVLLFGGISGTYELLFVAVVLAKLLVKISMGTIVIYTAELFPTSVRNSAVGVGHAFMFLGDIIAPFIMLLENLWYLAPISALSIPCIISALLILLLPDTMNKPVPDSIDELENSQRILESTTDGGEHMQLVVKDMHIP